MSLIEGIGDEVVEFFIGLIIIIIGKYDILLLYFYTPYVATAALLITVVFICFISVYKVK